MFDVHSLSATRDPDFSALAARIDAALVGYLQGGGVCASTSHHDFQVMVALASLLFWFFSGAGNRAL